MKVKTKSPEKKAQGLQPNTKKENIQGKVQNSPRRVPGLLSGLKCLFYFSACLWSLFHRNWNLCARILNTLSTTRLALESL